MPFDAAERHSYTFSADGTTNSCILCSARKYQVFQGSPSLTFRNRLFYVKMWLSPKKSVRNVRKQVRHVKSKLVKFGSNS